MELFKKRETVVQNIAYMAIMSAINVIFVLLSNILPVLLFLLVFVLPLTSTVVTLLCKKKYYPIYFIVTMLLCFLVSLGFSIFDTFVYVLPSLITGFIFGYAIEKRIPAIYIVVVSTLVQYCLTILTFFVMSKIVTNLDLLEAIIKAFGLADYEFKAEFTQIFLYIVSLIQILLAFFITSLEIKKLGYSINLYCSLNYILYFTEIAIAIVAILSYFYFPVYTIVITLIALPIYIYQLVILVLQKRIWVWASLVAAHFAFAFMYAFLNSYVLSPNHFILIFILFGLCTIIDFLSNYCLKQNKNNIK